MSTPPDFDGVHGTVCTEEQYQNSTNTNPTDHNPTLTCLTRGESIGLSIETQAAFLSLIAVTVIFVLIVRNVLRYRKALPNGGWKLLRGPTDIYMLSIFTFDLVQAMGHVLDVRWAHNGIAEIGTYCTIQGIIQQTGELGLALSILILTFHTFVVALWNVGSQARSVAFGMVALVTLFVGLWVGLGNGLRKHYETPTPYWCWMGPGNKVERLAGEYIWFWITLFASVVLNSAVYFWTKGHLSVNLQKLLFYPVVYAVMILPTTIARWSEFNNKHSVSSAAIFFCVFVFNLSGAANVLLFLIIRPQLLLFDHPDRYRETEEADIGQPTATSPVISDKAVKFSRSSQAIETELVDDGEWVPPLRSNDVALSPIESRPEV